MDILIALVMFSLDVIGIALLICRKTGWLIPEPSKPEILRAIVVYLNGWIKPDKSRLERFLSRIAS